MMCTKCGEPVLLGGPGCACARRAVSRAVEKENDRKLEEIKKFIEENPETMEKFRGSMLAYAARQDLLHVMKKISRNEFAAGWRIGLEYILWDLVVTGELEGRMMPTEAKHMAAMLSELAKRSQGWWVFGSQNQREFVPIREWLKMYFDRKDAENGVDANQRTP